MPFVFGSVGVGARQADAPARLVGRRRPHLLSGQQPAAVSAHRFCAQRCQIGAGARLGKQLAPKDFTPQRGRNELLDLFGRAVLEDGRRRPPADHQVGAFDAGRRHLLVDQQLLGRRSGAPVRLGPVRRLQARFGQRHLALVLGQRGDFGYG